MADAGSIGFAEVREVVRAILERAHERGYPLPSFVVLVGGSALAAHGIRGQSVDVDLYAEADLDVIIPELESELKPRFGPSFRLDYTTVPNIWGPVFIRDIADEPLIERLHVAGQSVDLRALSPEDLFLIKIVANREKDQRDLPEIAGRVGFGRLLERLELFVRWHGNKGGIPAFLDGFVRAASTHLRLRPGEVIDKLPLPTHVKEMLSAAFEHEGDE